MMMCDDGKTVSVHVNLRHFIPLSLREETTNKAVLSTPNNLDIIKDNSLRGGLSGDKAKFDWESFSDAMDNDKTVLIIDNEGTRYIGKILRSDNRSTIIINDGESRVIFNRNIVEFEIVEEQGAIMSDKKNNNIQDTTKPKYDAFFKFNLEKQEVAQAYIKQVVPQELSSLSDFSKMQLEPSEHIDPELRKLITDVLWSVPFKDSQYYTYFLCEHESGIKNHELLAFRFHKYIIRIMEKHLAKGNKKLPLVIPILLYHGTTKGYPHSVSIYDCFELKTLAEKYAFRDITLIDLTTMSDSDIANQGFRFFFELVLKYARDESLTMKLVESLSQHPHLTDYFQGQDFKKAFVNLLMSLDLDSEHAASETLKKLDNLTGVNIMTLREQWETKAQQHGIELGIEKGIEKTALNLSRMGLDDDKIVEATGLEKSVIEELKKTASKTTQH